MLYLTNYSEAERYSIKDSFNTQFRDLRLKDFTPGFIEAQFRSSLPSSFTVLNPYIFKFSKDDASFIYLGTFHILPFKVLPNNLIDMILSKECLFIEAFSEDTEDNQSPTFIASEEPEDWFLNLPTKFQQFLDVTLSNDGLPNCYLYPLDAMQDKISYIYTQGYQDCMDTDIVYSKNWNSIEALETCAERTNTEVLNSSNLETLLLEGLKELSNTTNYTNTYFVGQYGKKDFTAVEHDQFMQERNLKWATRIKTLMEEYQDVLSDNLVVAAGCNHLFHENGLLQLFTQEEWTIERVDLLGDWHEIEITADGYIA